MADVAFHELFGTTVVTRMVSRIKNPMQRFQDFLGMSPGGIARDSRPGRHFTWDIFDRTRKTARVRAPMTGPAAVSLDPIGQSSGVAIRVFEKRPLEWDRVYVTRPPGENFGAVDERGQRYVALQARNLGQRSSNVREFAISRMLHGQFYVEKVGEEWLVTDSPTNAKGGGNMKVDYQIPAANKGDLGGILTDWSNSATNIHQEILAISRKMERDHGRPLRHVWIPSIYLDQIMTNDSLVKLAGTANIVFQRYQPSGLMNVEGIEDTGYNVVLTGLPWLTWHVYDAGLEIYNPSTGNEEFTPLIPNKKAIFMPDPDPEIAEFMEGSEMVAENDGEIPRPEFGQVAYVSQKSSPALMEMHNLENFLPILYIPKAINFGDIVP